MLFCLDWLDFVDNCEVIGSMLQKHPADWLTTWWPGFLTCFLSVNHLHEKVKKCKGNILRLVIISYWIWHFFVKKTNLTLACPLPCSQLKKKMRSMFGIACLAWRMCVLDTENFIIICTWISLLRFDLNLCTATWCDWINNYFGAITCIS